MDVDAVPAPPQRVTNIYQEATPALYRLGQDSSHPAILRQLGRLNTKISEANKIEKIEPGQWTIPISFFGPHYNEVSRRYSILRDDPTNETAREEIIKEKTLIDSFIQKNHFPKQWTILTPDDYLKNTAASAVRSSQNSTEYPWTTAQAADGSLIVGVRKQGRFGTQVCIETQENDGRIIRRLESASEVGLLEVQRYWEMDGFKDLAQGQSQWSHKDRNDYDQLLWITKSQTKRKNIAANNKDPNADCCVKFHNKGIEILSVTSLTKVLGPSSARAEIEKVCKRDNILPPWKAGWVSEYSDPSKVEKDSARRRALRDAQATSSTDNRLDQKKYNVDGDKGKENLVVEQLEDRVKSLENEMKDMKSMTAMMNQNMETLMGMFKEFMKAKAGPGLSHF
ncbi:hypothetical protein B0T17DRAFT_582996 [Bombardia bombarda]|uniref:Uncharacterized protein n=1 Tax=Bombardia bombarda TaxID=252184 RepID=A0AA39WGT5_9PEZI|nr:hypothetical protein B0T17DRAFT_582996 [Bombardia bombarda]